MFESAIAEASARWGVPAPWIQAIIETESNWDPDAVNPADPSYGLMQILLSTARGLGFSGTVSELMDPATNIDLGTKLLRELRDRFGANFARVYSAYNSGDPDRYLTSEQVGSNVARAMAALKKYAPIGGAFALMALIVGWGVWRAAR